MKQAIRDRLVAQLGSGVTVSWNAAPRDEATPYVVLRQVGGVDEMNLDAPSGMRAALVQVNVYDDTPEAVEAQAQAIRTALSGYASAAVYGVFLQAARDEQPGEDIRDRVFGIQLDFQIAYRATS